MPSANAFAWTPREATLPVASRVVASPRTGLVLRVGFHPLCLSTRFDLSCSFSALPCLFRSYPYSIVILSVIIRMTTTIIMLIVIVIIIIIIIIIIMLAIIVILLVIETIVFVIPWYIFMYYPFVLFFGISCLPSTRGASVFKGGSICEGTLF